MINQIHQFHSELEKGQYVKIITSLDNYVTYVNRTDIIKANGHILKIFRANGAKVAINCQYVVACCVVKERL